MSLQDQIWKGWRNFAAHVVRRVVTPVIVVVAAVNMQTRPDHVENTALLFWLGVVTLLAWLVGGGLEDK